jgi:hypothetical protein
MKPTTLSFILLFIFSFSAFNAQAGWRSNNRHNNRQDNRQDNRKKGVVVVPRRRSFRNVVVVRPFGHAYHGYGHFHLDNDAWKWLAFTAINLKILDNINEAAQRAHEDAQIKAVTAPVGEKIIWSEGSASGSVVATKEGKNAKSGLTCREFQQTITVGDKIENAYGNACLQADGAWKIVQ